MVLLLSLPIWVLLMGVLVDPKKTDKLKREFRNNDKLFTVLVSIAVIFVLGLRTQYTGSRDTEMYFLTFNAAQSFTNPVGYLDFKGALDGFWLFSEGLFHLYTWLLAQIVPSAQWFLLISTAIMITFVANFIFKNSNDFVISWITFICLGLMTFSMNGLRQAMAMVVCLWSYEFSKKKKFIRFLIVVLMAILIHKSSLVFLFVYPICNMKFNWKNILILTGAVGAFLVYADSFVMFYDDLAEESYSGAESFSDGGLVVIVIYLLAIFSTLFFSKHIKEKKVFVPLVLAISGLVIYLCRFTSIQIYERISYYFCYFLVILFPTAFQDISPRYKKLIEGAFTLLAVLLFFYRVNKGAFSDFMMFWNEGF